MIQALASTLVIASVYGLLGVGYVLVYRASRVLNLAQGDMMTLGGYFLFIAAVGVGPAPAVAIPLAAAASALAGALIYRLLMRPMAGHPVFAAVLVTVTLGILLRAAIVMFFTDTIRHPRQSAVASAGRGRRLDLRSPDDGHGGRRLRGPLRVSPILDARDPHAGRG